MDALLLLVLVPLTFAQAILVPLLAARGGRDGCLWFLATLLWILCVGAACSVLPGLWWLALLPLCLVLVARRAPGARPRRRRRVPARP
jgi:hypothetical protein